MEAPKGMTALEARARQGSRAAFLRALKKADGQKRELEREGALPGGYSRQALIKRLKKAS